MSNNNTIEEYLETNRDRWDELVDHHYRSSAYGVNRVLSRQSTLSQRERSLLGDLSGKKILHLQCHFGLDTISLLFEGAEEVVGIDFSSRAVQVASELATELKVKASFIQANVLELDKYLDEIESFDVVFTSYGTIVWLPELSSWGKIIALYLKPSGKFLIVDAHPFALIFDDETDKHKLIPRYRYFEKDEPEYFKVEGSYATSAKLTHDEEYIWTHPISEIINSLTSSGLVINELKEYSTINWQMFPFLEKQQNGWYGYPENWKQTQVPLCFALSAYKSY